MMESKNDPLLNKDTPAPGSRDGRAHGGLGGVVLVAGLCWAAISAGFFGLKALLHERPQFAGPSVRHASLAVTQSSPRLAMRLTGEDAASVSWTQPRLADASIDLRGRRDYRGLKTVLDMVGNARFRYAVTNAFDQAAYVLFSAPRPRVDWGDDEAMAASGFELTASIDGARVPADDAWIWSGRLAPGAEVEIEFSYQVANHSQFRYLIEDRGRDVMGPHRARIRATDLPSLILESGEGRVPVVGGEAVWERDQFLAPEYLAARIGRTDGLFTALNHLAEIGPMVSLLFFASTLTVLAVKRSAGVPQVLTIAAGYGLFFPLVAYLSARFPFWMALGIATAAPGALLLNYLRWLFGFRQGVLGGAAFIGLFQLFPTLAALAGWNRGLVLLCLGLVTLAILIHLQNRSMMSRAAAAAVAFVLGGRAQAVGDEAQVLIPARLLAVAPDSERPGHSKAAISFKALRFDVEIRERYARVTWSGQAEVLEAGPEPVPLFAGPVYLQESSLPPCVSLASIEEGAGLFARDVGAGAFSLACHVPIEMAGSRFRMALPPIHGYPAQGAIRTAEPDIKLAGAALWRREAA